MESFFLLVCLVLINCVACNEKNESSIKHYNRKEKSFFFLPPIIPLSSLRKRKQPSTKQPCIGDCGLQGVCSTRADCVSGGGTPSGLCTDSTVCCISYVKCGNETNADISYFVNAGFPATYQGGSQCSVKVRKTDARICQVRVEFKEFTLAQPSSSGMCVNDFFTISDSLTNKICGDNKGQHVYANFVEGGDTIMLSFDTNGAERFSRLWNLEIKQIPCNSTLLAPSGCLMYFTGTSGSVSSFNYGTLSVQENRRNRLINGLNYGICVRSTQEYCSIEWSQDRDLYSFTLSEDSSSIPPNSGVSLSGQMCNNNFIVIANPYRNGSALNEDRFCGSAFSPIATSTKPFAMYAVIGQNVAAATNDGGNRGFKLNFRQLPC